MIDMKGLCEFDWSKGKQDTYTCIKCKQVITHEKATELKRINAVLFCKVEEEK